MSGLSASGLKTMIKNYTEVDSTVFTDDILENLILNAQQRIFYDVPIDSDRVEYQGTLAADTNTVRVPAGMVFVRGVEVFNSTSSRTGPATWLQKRDRTFLNEYVGQLTGPEGSQTGQDTTGLPKYYAMFGGATGLSSTTSGNLIMAPTPDANYLINIHGNVMPVTLEGSNTNYISLNFPQGLLYACLVEAYGFLKGPQDMLTLYENKYKQELAKFASVQIGRRRRDDYTDGTVRIPIESPPQ
ncbi:hypothetical protein [uncultured Mediterranean phage]|nr:hypothetical protein [uncultured Mediterranean phage]